MENVIKKKTVKVLKKLYTALQITAGQRSMTVNK